MSQQTQHLTLHQFGYVDTGHGWCVLTCRLLLLFLFWFCFVCFSSAFSLVVFSLFLFHFYVLPNPFITVVLFMLVFPILVRKCRIVFFFSLSSVYLNSKLREGNCWEKEQSSYTYGTCPMAIKSHIHFAEKKLYRQTMIRHCIKDDRIYIQRITIILVL